jgi:ADP-heptose:LPS heptosyltransferase
MKLPKDSVHKIAVFRALQLGDMLCVIPAIRSLRHAYPNAEITLLGLPWAKSFVQRFNKYFDRFIHFPGYEGLPEQVYNEHEFSKFISQLQTEKFDLVLQMQGNGTIVNPLMFLFEAKYVAGFYNNESYVHSDLFIEYPNFGSEIHRHLILIEHLGIDAKDSDLEFPINEKDMKEFSELTVPLFEKKYICIHPGSRDVRRQWPPQYFAALADYCIGQGFTIAVTGTIEEQDITRELIKWIHHPVIDLTGKTSLGAAALLIKNAFMLISNCTGVSHIASAVKTPGIIISMDGEPERWAPLNKTIHRTIDCKEHSHFDKVYQETVSLIEECRGLAF